MGGYKDRAQSLCLIVLALTGCAKYRPCPPAPPTILYECDETRTKKKVCHNHRTLDVTGAEAWDHLQNHLFDYAGECRPRTKETP